MWCASGAEDAVAILDEVLTALRTRLEAVPGIPAIRYWENIIPDSNPSNLDTYTQDSVQMGVKQAMSLPVDEQGTRWWSWEGCLYQVTLHYPPNTTMHAPLALASAVAETFDGSSLTAAGGAVRIVVVSVRVANALGDASGVSLPVQIRFRIEHFTA